jgi:pimeloyl-ACP methyl ester carboxylesterase
VFNRLDCRAGPRTLFWASPTVFLIHDLEEVLTMERFWRENRNRLPIPDATHRGIAAERWEELREFRTKHLPKHTTAAQLLDELAGVLDAEGVRAAHVLGPSYSGLVAQCLVRRHPKRVQTLILANTAVPPPRLLWPARVFLALLPLAPLAWLRKFREWTLARAFSGVPSVPPEDQAFWRDYQHGLVSRLSKEDLRSMYWLGIDLVEGFRFTPDDLASWPGRVLILESDEDLVTPEQRASLRRCYPRAEVHTFRGAGHAPWMSHKEEYLSAIKEFLDR